LVILPSLRFVRADPGHRRVVSPTTRVDPVARTAISIRAKRAPVKGRGAYLAGPNREAVLVQLVHIIQGHAAPEVIETGADVCAGFCPERLFVADHFDTADALAVLDQVNFLHQEKAAFRPAVGDLAL